MESSRYMNHYWGDIVDDIRNTPLNKIVLNIDKNLFYGVNLIMAWAE